MIDGGESRRDGGHLGCLPDTRQRELSQTPALTADEELTKGARSIQDEKLLFPGNGIWRTRSISLSSMSVR